MFSKVFKLFVFAFIFICFFNIITAAPMERKNRYKQHKRGLDHSIGKNASNATPSLAKRGLSNSMAMIGGKKKPF